jgi:hypothetical protein
LHYCQGAKMHLSPRVKRLTINRKSTYTSTSIEREVVLVFFE